MRPRRALRVLRAAAEDLDAVMEEDEDEDEGAIDEDEDEDDEAGADDENLAVQKKRLDLTIEYLRRVFSFCFFCVFESDSVHELTRKCPGGHLRRPRMALSSAAREVALASVNGDPFPAKAKAEPNEEGEVEASDERRHRNPLSKADQQLLRAFNWVRTFEDKINQFLQPETVDLRRLGGRDIDEAMREETLKFVKQEDERKWRCKVPDCPKMFKEEHFWRKHMDKRHGDLLSSLQQEVGWGWYCAVRGSVFRGVSF
jgi:hypothetical protein